MPMHLDDFIEIDATLKECDITFDVDDNHFSIFLKTEYTKTLDEPHLDDLIGVSSMNNLKVGDVLTNPYQVKSYLRVVEIDSDNNRVLLDLV